MSTEKQNYQTLKAKLPKGKDRIDRVENVAINGMPDVNYCTDGVEVWIEMKSAVEPKRENSILLKHKLSQDQMNWMKRQIDAGGKCNILIATDKRWMLIGGQYADEVNSLSVKDLLLIAKWHANKPVKKSMWQFLRHAIRKEV